MKAEKVSEENERLYRLMQEELDIHYKYKEVKHRTLEELDITEPEINWFLNKFEWRYGVEIQEVEITWDTTIDALFHQILLSVNGAGSARMNEHYKVAI